MSDISTDVPDDGRRYRKDSLEEELDDETGEEGREEGCRPKRGGRG